MPKELEEKLRKQANKKGIKDKGAYIFGTMYKLGWRPGKKKK